MPDLSEFRRQAKLHVTHSLEPQPDGVVQDEHGNVTLEIPGIIVLASANPFDGEPEDEALD